MSKSVSLRVGVKLILSNCIAQTLFSDETELVTSVNEIIHLRTHRDPQV